MSVQNNLAPFSVLHDLLLFFLCCWFIKRFSHIFFVFAFILPIFSFFVQKHNFNLLKTSKQNLLVCLKIVIKSSWKKRVKAFEASALFVLGFKNFEPLTCVYCEWTVFFHWTLQLERAKNVWKNDIMCCCNWYWVYSVSFVFIVIFPFFIQRLGCFLLRMRSHFSHELHSFDETGLFILLPLLCQW